MIKKISLLLVLTFQFGYSQVGIGTTNPSASSALEIRSTNSGLLIPRVALTSSSDVTTIASPATSLLVYNTNTVSDVTAGFYYWEGSWKPLKGSASASSGWNLTGNTVTATDYLGTNNSSPLLFKVNNAQFAKFHQNGGITIGNLASANDDRAIAIGTSAKASSQDGTAVGPTADAAQDAIALGKEAKASYQSVALGLKSSTAGNTGVAIGSSAKVTAQNGVAMGTLTEATQDAIAIGNSAKATGYQSIAVGFSTTSNTNNTLAVGNTSQATAQNATAVGYAANSSGQNATAIGYQATATQATSIILGNATDANSKVGIGTSTPTEKLHVGGSVRIVDGTQANNYVLTSDANGKATWKDPNASMAFAEISRNSNLELPSGTVSFTTVGENLNMNAVTTSGIQIKTPGIYRITYSLSLSKDATAGTLSSYFALSNGSSDIATSRAYYTIGSNANTSVSLTKLIYLNVGQTVSVRSETANTSVNILANSASLLVELVK